MKKNISVIRKKHVDYKNSKNSKVRLIVNLKCGQWC